MRREVLHQLQLSTASPLVITNIEISAQLTKKKLCLRNMNDADVFYETELFPAALLMLLADGWILSRSCPLRSFGRSSGFFPAIFGVVRLLGVCSVSFRCRFAFLALGFRVVEDSSVILRVPLIIAQFLVLRLLAAGSASIFRTVLPSLLLSVVNRPTVSCGDRSLSLLSLFLPPACWSVTCNLRPALN